MVSQNTRPGLIKTPEPQALKKGLVLPPPLPPAVPVRDAYITREDLVVTVLSTPSVPVNTESTFTLEFTDLEGHPIGFVHLSITEVDIIATQLSASDAVRLRIFRSGQRRVPQDLVAEFSGASQVSDTWASAFSNRRIEYTDLSKQSKLYLNVRNNSGNSVSTTFEVWVYGRTFPKG